MDPGRAVVEMHVPDPGAVGADLFLNGRTVKTLNASGAAGEVAKQDFSGSYGYVME